MTLPELITVLQAAHDGKTIQARSKGSEQWMEIPILHVGELGVRLSRGDILRVKPEPRVGFAPEHLIFESREHAGRLGWGQHKLIHVREVLP